MRFSSDSGPSIHVAKRLMANGAISFGTVCVVLSSMAQMAQSQAAAIVPADTTTPPTSVPSANGAKTTLPLANPGANSVPASAASAPAAPAPLASPAFGLMPQASPTLPQGQATLDLKFEDTAVADIVKLISEQGNVQIIINGDVNEKLQYINLSNITPEQAIEKVAQAANLTWRKLEDKTYIIAKNLPDAPKPTGIIPIDPLPAPAPGDPGVRAYAQPNLDNLPKLLQNDRTATDEPEDAARSYQYIKIRNVSPRMMAWWIDPSHNPKPVEIQQSEDNVRRFFDHSIAQPAVGAGAASMYGSQSLVPPFQSPYASAGSLGSGDNGGWSTGGGYDQFVEPYTQDNAQFGFGGNGGGFGNNGGGFGNNGGGRRGGRNGRNGGNNRNGGNQRGNRNGGGGGGNGGGGLFDLPEGIDSIVAVDPQNALLVYGTTAGLQQLQTIINYLDLPLRQVEIEAQFVDVAVTDTNLFGIDFSSGNGALTLSQSVNPANPPSGTLVAGFVRNNFRLTLNALLSTSRAKVVTAPRVTAINNLTAQLVSSTLTPVVTTNTVSGIGGQVGTGQNITYVPASTVLFVTPTINNDDTITVRMRPQIQSTSNPLPGTNAPFISTQSVDTTAIVHDGDTIALGGLRTKNITVGGTRVPVLSSIPFLGKLFRTNNNNDTERELIIFLTAKIVRRADDDLQIPNT
ncbi:MAG: hypothetical protein JO316_20485 [Abitibacteriaceae bacterium]|nr:hypothetical protein [Abditibacteriaceae bacterium]MBV9867736.1 hypothetical protein [Abditibacteriaceae bacterium]